MRLYGECSRDFVRKGDEEETESFAKTSLIKFYGRNSLLQRNHQSVDNARAEQLELDSTNFSSLQTVIGFSSCYLISSLDAYYASSVDNCCSGWFNWCCIYMKFVDLSARNKSETNRQLNRSEMIANGAWESMITASIYASCENLS